MKILSMEIKSCNIRSYITWNFISLALTATLAPAKTGEDKTKKEKVMHKRYFKIYIKILFFWI